MTTPHRRGPWSTAEDSSLKELVGIHGPLNWVIISQTLRSRSPKQCRERYHQNLKPSLRHDPITMEEGRYIEALVRDIGKRWAEIARRLTGRSDNAVKNWWNGSQNRRRRLDRRRALSAAQPAPGESHEQRPLPPIPQHRHAVVPSTLYANERRPSGLPLPAPVAPPEAMACTSTQQYAAAAATSYGHDGSPRSLLTTHRETPWSQSRSIRSPSELQLDANAEGTNYTTSSAGLGASPVWSNARPWLPSLEPQAGSSSPRSCPPPLTGPLPAPSLEERFRRLRPYSSQLPPTQVRTQPASGPVVAAEQWNRRQPHQSPAHDGDQQQQQQQQQQELDPPGPRPSKDKRMDLSSLLT